MALENLTTYTSVDSDGDFTINTSAAIFTTMRRDAVSYVYTDFGADYFHGFEVDFEFKIDSGVSDSQAVLCATSNTLGTFNDFINASDAILVWAYIVSGNLRFYLSDYSGPVSDNYVDGGTSSNLLYGTFRRASGTATLEIYSDSGRTVLVDTLSIACEDDPKRYFYVLASRDSSTSGSDAITGYVQNYEIQFNSSSSSTSSSSTSSSSSSLSFSSSSSTTVQLYFRDADDGGTIHRSVWYDGVHPIAGGNGFVIIEDIDEFGQMTRIDRPVFGGDKYGITGYDDFIFTANGGSGGLRSGTLSGSTYVPLDLIDNGYDYVGNLFADENFVYAACGTFGLVVYSYDDNGILTFEDRDDQGDDYRGVWSDGRYVYTACTTSGIRSHYVAPDGTIQFIDQDDQGSSYRTIWGDGNFLYVCCWNGLRTYRVSPIGGLIPIDHVYRTGSGGAGDQSWRGAWGDGEYIYVAAYQDIFVYSVDGSGYLKYETYVNTLNQVAITTGGQGLKGNFVYGVDTTQGLYAYEMFSSSSQSSSSVSSSSESSSSSSSSTSSSSSSSLSSSSSSSSESSSSSSESSSSSSLSSSSTAWETARIRRRYKGMECIDDDVLYDFIEYLEDRFIFSSSSQSSSSYSSSSSSFSSSSRSSVSSSSSSVSFSSSSTSFSSSSNSSSSSSSSSTSSSSSSVSSSSNSSSSSSSSSSTSSSSSSTSSSSSSTSSSSTSSSSTSSSSSSCFISFDDDFNQSDGTPPDIQRWSVENGNLIVSGGELLEYVDSTTNLSNMRSRPQFFNDFDVQVDWRQLPGPNNLISGWNIGMEVITLGYSDDPIGTKIYKRAHTNILTEEPVSGGSLIPGTDTSVAYSASSGQFRVALSGSNWQTYYRTTPVSAWNPIGGPYSMTPTELTRVWLYVENYSGTPDVSGAFDNLLVNSGSWRCPGSISSSSSSSSSSISSSSSSSSISSSSSSSISSSSSSLSSSSSSLSDSSSSSSSSISFAG